DSLTVSSTLARGSMFDITTLWSNLGVTPAYSSWNVLFQLRDPATGKIAWQGSSQLDLQRLLPTRIDNVPDAPVSVTDHLTLSGALVSGHYQLVIQIVDPDGYYPPLALAIRGRNGDGSYVIGDIAVN